jgi:RNA polymerase sigma factor (sigma-70 family)
MTMEWDFDDILSAARAGEQWAWTRIYRALAPQVRGYLAARGATDADDVTGEVFLQVVRDIRSFSGGERDFSAWVFAIAHHRLLDEVRKVRRHPEDLVSDQAMAERISPVDAEEEALRSVTRDLIRTVLRRLSPDQQSVLTLRILADLPVEQVADVIGKRPGAVKALQRRGLAAMKREMSREAVSI